MPALDQYSLVSLPLEMIANGHKISDATGFFYSRNDTTYLVTNWHVLSGRNPFNGQPMSKTCAIPDKIVLPLHEKGNLGSWRNGCSVELGNDSDDVRWIQHPSGQDIDVAAIPLASVPHEVEIYGSVRPDETSEMSVLVGMDIYIVGFPLGLAKQGIFPVWKRGSVASEPALPVDGLPLFLVDSATRQGMSGSPVYVRSFGGALLENGEYAIGTGAFTRFLGVYSGRYGADDEFAAQLGRVWHRGVLDELIDGGQPGSYVLR